MRSRSKLFTVLVACWPRLLLPLRPVAQDRVFTADPGQSRVEFTLGATMHTVHGTFSAEIRNAALHTATGAAEGQLVVDAESGDSENKSRDGR